MSNNRDTGYKVVEMLIYTEVVYYDAHGNEVDRMRNNDDHLWDSDPPENLTDSDVEDYYR